MGRFSSLFLVTAVLLTAATAAAADTEGINLYKGWRLAEFRVEGLDRSLSDRLVSGLALPSRIKRVGINRPLLYPAVVEEDLRRTLLFLARNGFPRAEARARAEKTGGARNVRIVFSIDPGPPVLVSTFAVEGFPPPLELAVRRRAPLRAGERFTEEKVVEAARVAEETLRDSGYARGAVEHMVERDGEESVRVLIRADPGNVCFFGDFHVEGAAEDLVPLVRKTVSLPRGERYSPDRVRRSGSAVRMLGLFRRIRMETVDGNADTLHLLADLAERRSRTVDLDIAYWTDDLLRGSVRWEHRNLLRRGRGGAVEVSASRYRQNAATSLWWPALFRPRLRGSLSLSAAREWEESYDLTNLSFRLGALHRASERVVLSGDLSFSRVDVNDKTGERDAFIEEGGLLGALHVEWRRDGRDDRIDPRGGTVAFAAWEWSPPGPWTASPFLSTEVSLAGFLPLFARSTLAGRATLGVARPLGDSPDLLPNKRFYSGGANRMRGFRRRKLGPLDEDGAPIGGEAKAEFSLEGRFPLFWRLRGALFADAGAVWSDRGSIDWRDLETAFGPGLMVKTPIGPIRADLGYRAGDRIADQPRWVFHFSIGNPF